MDLGAGVPRGVAVGEGRDGLRGRERARRRIQPLARDAAALLIGEIDEIEGRMKTQVAWTEAFRRRDLQWRTGRQTTRLRVEPELENHVGSGIVARWLQHIVIEPGDVRYKGKTVGPVGLDGMSAARRSLPVDG